MNCTRPGICNSVSDVQPLKALIPIFSSVSGKSTLRILTQLSKAESFISVNRVENLTDSNEMQP